MNLLREKVLSRGVIHTPTLPSHLFQPKKRGGLPLLITLSLPLENFHCTLTESITRVMARSTYFFCQSCEMLTKYAESSFLILGTLNEVISNDSIKRIAKPTRFFFFGNLTKLAQRFQVAILKILVIESQKHVFIVEI